MPSGKKRLRKNRHKKKYAVTPGLYPRFTGGFFVFYPLINVRSR